MITASYKKKRNKEHEVANFSEIRHCAIVYSVSIINIRVANLIFSFLSLGSLMHISTMQASLI